MIGLFIMLGVSLNLLLGYGGLVSMAQAAFFGVGAYAAALSARDLGLPFPLTLVVAIAVTTLLACVVTFPALRVRGEYLILLTLAFQMVIYGLMLSWVDLTAGRTGISGIPRPRLFGKTLVTPAEFLPLIAAGALVTFAIAYRIGESPLGRVLKAMRDDETATLAIGKSVLRYKVLVFCVSGGLAGGAAGLFAHYQAFINPFSFNLLTGFLAAEAGTVALEGEDITRLAPWRTVRLGLARSFQDVRLFERMTVLDNVLVALPTQPGERLGPL